jgi:hypothetical protein
MSAKDPDLLAEHRIELDLLSESLGLSGSVAYKPPERRRDIDFVVYGRQECEQAYRRISDPHPQQAPRGRPDRPPPSFPGWTLRLILLVPSWRSWKWIGTSMIRRPRLTAR